MLTTFLTGLGLGGLLLGAWERRARGQGPASAWRRLSGLQAGIGLSALLSIFVIGGLEGVSVAADGSWGARTLRQLGLSAAVMLPPTLMMGMSLPLVARLAGAGRGVGEAVGRVYAANTAGAVLGSLAGGFCLAPLLGTQHSLILLALVNLALAAAVLRAAPPSVRSGAKDWPRALAGAWAVAGLGVLVLPSDLPLRALQRGRARGGQPHAHPARAGGRRGDHHRARAAQRRSRDLHRLDQRGGHDPDPAHHADAAGPRPGAAASRAPAGAADRFRVGRDGAHPHRLSGLLPRRGRDQPVGARRGRRLLRRHQPRRSAPPLGDTFRHRRRQLPAPHPAQL